MESTEQNFGGELPDLWTYLCEHWRNDQGQFLESHLEAVAPHLQFRFLCYPGKEMTKDTAQRSNIAHVLASGLRGGALSALPSSPLCPEGP